MKMPTLLTTIFSATVFLLTGCGGTDNNDLQDTGCFGPLVDTILNHSKIEFKQLEKDNITFYYESDDFFEDNIHKLANEAILSRNHCIRLLGNKKTAYPIKIIYFNDREKLRPFLHIAPKGYALPDVYALLIAANDSIRAYHTHELMHIVSINQFGGYAAGPADWIQEGIAVYADNPCMEYPIHAIAANLYYAKQLTPLDSLFHQFRTLPDMAGYMQAGSVVQFFLEKYGLDKFERLWKKGVENMEQIINKDKSDFEKEYHKFLRQTYPQQPEINWSLLNEKGCG